MRFKILIALLTFSLFNSLYAESYYVFKYTVREEDTLEAILKKFVKPNSIINAKSPMIQKLFRKNPHVRKWRMLAPGTEFQLYVNKEYLIMDRYKTYEKERIQYLRDKYIKKKFFPDGIKGSIFYMASLGMFTQSTPEMGTIDFNQNSPVTLGTSFTYYPKGKTYSTNINGYYSYLTGATNSLDGSTVDIPPELGFALFQEYRYEKMQTTFYGGPDYEKFTTFNLSEAHTSRNIYLDESSVIYATAGASRLFTILDRKCFIKASLSAVVNASTKTTAPSGSAAENSTGSTSYSGYKTLFYLNYKFSDKYFFHSLLKYHALSGPTDVKALRVGVGIGYILF